MVYLIRLLTVFTAFIANTALHGDVNYVAYDMGTLATASSQITDLNEEGCAVGTFETDEGWADFIWNHETGLQIIHTDATMYSKPRLNKNGQVVGVMWQKKVSEWFFGFFNSVTYVKEYYLYDPVLGIQPLGIPQGWKTSEISENVYNDKALRFMHNSGNLGVVSFNDVGQILICDNTIPSEAKKWAVWENNQFTEINKDRFPPILGLNNHSEIMTLLKTENTLTLSLHKLNTNETDTLITTEKNTIPIFVDDAKNIILFSFDKMEGFVWNPLAGMSSIGSFFPTFLNSQGDILGFVLVKKADNTLPNQSGTNNFKDYDLVPSLMHNGEVISLHNAIDASIHSLPNFEGLAWIRSLKTIWMGKNFFNSKGQIALQGHFGTGENHALILVPRQISPEE